MDLSMINNTKSIRIYRRLVVGSAALALGVVALISLKAYADLELGQQPISQRQPLKNVHSLYVDGPADVILRQGDEEYVKVSGLPEQIDKMYSQIHGKRLHIEVPRNPGAADLVVVEIQLKKWRKIDLDRKVQRVEWDDLKSKELDFRVAGGADVNGKSLAAEALEVSIAGRARVEIQSVSGGEVALNTAGSSRVDIKSFAAVEMAELELSGSGDLELNNLAAPTIEVDISGAGEVSLGKIEANSVEFEMAGSGEVEVTEKALIEVLDIEMAGSAKAQVKPLQAKSVHISIVGSGTADVTATESLYISVAGSGNVRYWGNPKPIKKRVIGSASILYMGQPQ